MSKRSRPKLPFEIEDGLEYEHIVFTKPIIAGMYCGEANEQTAIDKIIPHLNDDLELVITRRFGFTGPERRRMAKAGDLNRDTQLKALKLFQKLAKEKGVPLTEITQLVDERDASGIPSIMNDERFMDHIEELSEMMGEFESTSPEESECTQLMIREIPGWKEADTLALSSHTYDQLCDLAIKERDAVPAETEDSEGNDLEPLRTVSMT